MKVWWIAGALLSVAGCFPGRQDTARGPALTPAPNTAPGSSEPKDGPTDLNSGPMKMPPVENNRALVIQPTGREGWKERDEPLAKLGAAMDSSLAGLKEAFAEAEIIYVNKGNTANAKLNWKIRDANTYRIEWIEPTTEANINYLVRDGDRSGIRYDGGSVKPKPWPMKPATQSLDLEKFASDPLRAIVGNFETGHGFWRTLLAELEAGKGGFQAKAESAELGVRGKARKITRIVAKSPAGTEIEVVVDDERKLPLTVKTSKMGPGGTLDKALWTAKWASGGRHADSDFRTP
ncbi:MAG: hypothetical protein IT207_05260 [Fimbriimonadaceae bacterium]|nr:hypothetical protein [Fimbriimonadaceae bacterium]